MALVASLSFLILGGVSVTKYLANRGSMIVIGTKDDVYYSGKATKADAQQLGDALKASGYFSDKGADVLLKKGAEGTQVSFIVKEGSWEQPSMVASFEEFGRQIAPSVGGFPIQLRLLNNAREVKEESTIGRVELPGKDDVFYLGSATQAQAQALANALKSGGFFQGKGTDVFLTKHSDGTTLTFVVQAGVWDNAAMVEEFENTLRQVAPTIGGLPARLHLANTALEVKKDEVIR